MSEVQSVQWFPGHMAKTRRLMQENLKLVDIVIELRDARIPYSSKNPEIEKLIGDKPRLILLNKASLADPAVSRAWLAVFAERGERCLLIDCVSGRGIADIYPAVCELLGPTITGPRMSNRFMFVRPPLRFMGYDNRKRVGIQLMCAGSFLQNRGETEFPL